MSHHKPILELNKQGKNKDLHLIIDEKVEGQTWIIRVINENEPGTNFSCLVNKLNRGNNDTCSIEIARAKVASKSFLSRFAEQVRWVIMFIYRPIFKVLSLKIAHVPNSRNSEEAAIIANFIMCKPLFRFLGIKHIEWQRALNGKIRKYTIK